MTRARQKRQLSATLKHEVLIWKWYKSIPIVKIAMIEFSLGNWRRNIRWNQLKLMIKITVHLKWSRKQAERVIRFLKCRSDTCLRVHRFLIGLFCIILAFCRVWKSFIHVHCVFLHYDNFSPISILPPSILSWTMRLWKRYRCPRSICPG